jgi:hypothetical protein
MLKEVLGRTNHICSLETTITAQKMKNVGEYTQQGDIISLLTKLREIHKQQGGLIRFLSVFKIKIKLKKEQFQHIASMSFIGRVSRKVRLQGT